MRRPRWGLAARVLGLFLLLLGVVLLISFVGEALSDDSEILDNVLGNLALFLAIVPPNLLIGFLLFRWGRNQREPGTPLGSPTVLDEMTEDRQRELAD